MGRLLCGSMVRLTATSSKRAYATPRSAAPRAPAAVHCWPKPPQETLKHLKAGLAQSLWGLWVLVHTGFVWAFQESLAGLGFDSKHDFTPPILDAGYLLLVGSNILLSMVVQQQVVILEFSQKKMSSRPSILPSWELSQDVHAHPKLPI